MKRFSGKTVLITGGASGIGRGTAIRFAEEGAKIALADLNTAGGLETAGLCEAAGGEAIFIETDVSCEQAMQDFVESAASRLGGIDVLFNNAGFPGAVGPIEALSVEDWDKTFSVLVRSVFLGMKFSVPHMKQRGGGAIVSTSSIGGLRGYAFGHAYSACKSALLNLTRSAAVELGRFNIRVNCICPGQILTPMAGGDHSDLAALEADMATRQPIPRAGRPEDIGNAVLYLASKEAGFITGEIITIDGGLLAGCWDYKAPAEQDVPSSAGFIGPSFQIDAQGDA
ncbi:SDR family NAD(P)-dependent oxidoreductase [Novosphingobium pentaromativorans]|uniref:Short-chain dehydrogenase/reductase SDR n=1 Tax=Novosphingobium pentaromativorans US6-1 TaxID=1088721 RepID=G6EGP0_9SPHN|nr:SDR family NAD(P)-dependent oxidoreductase [Novosphingobium pentaromativorans]EHJ59587.1 hypothetical protein NSU_3470 [Novosphingobium pentaromativorans US6-1]